MERSHWRESNPRPTVYETVALPLSHSGTETAIEYSYKTVQTRLFWENMSRKTTASFSINGDSLMKVQSLSAS